MNISIFDTFHTASDVVNRPFRHVLILFLSKLALTIFLMLFNVRPFQKKRCC